MVIVLWYSLIFYSVLSTAFSLFIKERYHDPELEGKSEPALLACIQYIDDITTCSHREDQDPSSAVEQFATRQQASEYTHLF